MSLGESNSRKPSAAIALLVALTAFYVWTANPSGAINYVRDGGSSGPYNAPRQLEAQGPNAEFTVCGRPTDYTSDLKLEQQYATCPEYDAETPIVLLETYMVYCRTMNQMRSFLMSIQYARDEHYQLGMMRESWATDLLLEFFMVNNVDGSWEAQVEQALCVKIIHSPEELEGREIIRKSALELFSYHSPSTSEDYVASQLDITRTLFQYYNTGEGQNHYGNPPKDMCSGIYQLFSKESEDISSVVYSVIHLRHLENVGPALMKWVANETGSDPTAGLAMTAAYIKAILGPIGMLEHPIVVISDGQNPMVLRRLMQDSEIGPMIYETQKWARWIGGDITLATMANAFIGNPASTFSLFIGQSRKALGFGNTYLHMARDSEHGWISVCDNCLLGAGADDGDNDHFRHKQGQRMVDKRGWGNKHADNFGMRGMRPDWYRKNLPNTTPVSVQKAREKIYRQHRLSSEEWKQRQA